MKHSEEKITWHFILPKESNTRSKHLFRQVVVDDERMAAVVTEELPHGAAGVRREVLKGSGIRGGGAHDNGVLHCVGICQSFDDLRDGRPLLSDGNINAVKLCLLVLAVVEALLVDDGVDGNGRLAASFKKTSYFYLIVYEK